MECAKRRDRCRLLQLSDSAAEQRLEQHHHHRGSRPDRGPCRQREIRNQEEVEGECRRVLAVCRWNRLRHHTLSLAELCGNIRLHRGALHAELAGLRLQADIDDIHRLAHPDAGLHRRAPDEQCARFQRFHRDRCQHHLSGPESRSGADGRESRYPMEARAPQRDLSARESTGMAMVRPRPPRSSIRHTITCIRKPPPTRWA